MLGLLGGCRQLQDSQAQEFLCASFTNWALGQQWIMIAVCQGFCMREEKERGKENVLTGGYFLLLWLSPC